MKEISNSTLALLVIVAIVVSVAGTFLSIGKLSDLGITGFASSGAGTANLTVSGEASISIDDNFINFTSPFEVSTSSTNYSNSSDLISDYWTVTNIGSVNVTIKIYGSQDNNVSGNGPFSSGGDPSADANSCYNNTYNFYNEDGGENLTVNRCFKIQCNSTTSAATACNTTWDALGVPNDIKGLDNRIIHADLDWRDEANYASFGVNVTIPTFESGGVKTQSVTFLATSSS